jgi:hypothetical protein
MVAAGRGRRADAESWLQKFDGVARTNHFGAVRVALCRARLGDKAAALDWLERASLLGHHRWNSLMKHPWLAPLRTEARFVETVGEIKRNLDSVRPDVLGVYPSMCRPAAAGSGVPRTRSVALSRGR